MKRFVSQLGSVLCALGLAACAGAGAPSNPSPPPPPAAGLIGLPSPADLARSSSFTEPGLMREGSEFDPTLPLNRTLATGSDANFTPVENGTDASSLAYCVYSFDVSGYDRDLSLRFNWVTQPATNSGWVALANFATNRWEWARLTVSNTLSFSDLAAHTSPAPATALYAAVLVTGGSQAATLDRVRVGAQPNTGTPTADLQADVSAGAPPLLVNFDASASTANAPATLEKYEFDFGDGAGFADFGLIATASHSYAIDGVFTAQVRVTDVFGAQDTDQVTVTVTTPPPYDEVEPNDFFPNEANALPAFRVVDWRGNCGVGGSYDGDVDDYASFNASPGDSISAELLTDFDTGNLDLELRDSDGDQLALANGATDREFLVYNFAAGDTAPFYLHIIATTGQSDYLLTVQHNPPVANLAAVPPSGNVPLVTSLDASGSTDQPPGTIATYEFDPLGDDNFTAPQAGSALVYQYDNAGTYNPIVRITDSDGNVMTATCTVQANGSSFGEVENNDFPGQASPLPAFPFAGFLCSHFTGAGYPGYDGDDFDFHSFDAASGTVTIQITFDNATGGMSCSMSDNNGTQFGPVFDNTGVLTYTYVIGSNPGDDGAPYYIGVGDLLSTGHYGDYTIQGSIVP